MSRQYLERDDSRRQGWRGRKTFIETPVHEEALSRLLYLVEQHRRFGLMYGPAGTGKSLVLKAAQRESLRMGRLTAAVDLVGLDSHEFLWQLTIALRLGAADGRSRWWLWQAISDHFAALRSANLPVVLLFDHLDRADSDCLAVIERLLHSAEAHAGFLTILSAARDAFRDHFALELTELCDLRIELPRLNREDTAQLVRELVRPADNGLSPFDASAIDELHEFSGGETRVIERLANLAMTARESRAMNRINAAILREIAAELPTPDARRSDRLLQTH